MLALEPRRRCLALANDLALISCHDHGHLVADFDYGCEDVVLLVDIEQEEAINSNSITDPSATVTTDGAASLLRWRILCFLILVKLSEIVEIQTNCVS